MSFWQSSIVLLKVEMALACSSIVAVSASSSFTSAVPMNGLRPRQSSAAVVERRVRTMKLKSTPLSCPPAEGTVQAHGSGRSALTQWKANLEFELGRRFEMGRRSNVPVLSSSKTSALGAPCAGGSLYDFGSPLATCESSCTALEAFSSSIFCPAESASSRPSTAPTALAMVLSIAPLVGGAPGADTCVTNASKLAPISLSRCFFVSLCCAAYVAMSP